MSPIQFQKQLRLQEARRLLLINEDDALDVAFQVGYESPLTLVASILGCSDSHRLKMLAECESNYRNE